MNFKQNFYLLALALGLLLAVGPWQTALADDSATNVSAITVTRGPYLQIGTPNSIVVRWRTQSESDSRVRFGTDINNLDQIADVAAGTIEHEVELTGLSPKTQYFYAVGNSSDDLATSPDYFFVTAPPVGTRQNTRIWILGDSGTGDQNAKNVRDAYYAFTGTRHTDLWVMVGDNAYDDGKDSEYQQNMFDIYPTMLSKSVIWPAFGNHDGHSANSNTESGPFYNIFTLPRNAEAGGVASGTEAYYAFDFANIHFICLNSHDIDRSQNGPMLQWLTQDLANNSQDWTIAYWHHPPYTKGSHDSDRETQLIQMRENALPILESNGVDLVISGHSHSYERSFLLDQHYGMSGTLDSSMILDGGDGRLDGDGNYAKATVGSAAHEGTVYVVAGSSGKTSGGSLNHPAMFISRRMLGSVVLDVDGDQLDLTFLDKNANRQDYFTMIKGGGVVSIAGTQVSSFAGQAGDGSVALQWVTQREVGVAGFEVLRANQAGGTFARIASFRDQPDLKGSGNSGNTRHYAFYDENLINGQDYWYKIEIVGLAGERESYGPIRTRPTSPTASSISGDIPKTLALQPNYPNPFNPATTLRFDLPATDAPFYNVRLEIFDIRGGKIKMLLNGKYAPGSYAVQWDATNANGVKAPSGVYVSRLIANQFRQSRKMILTR